MVSPNAGTPGSTLITALVPGVGKETTGLNLVNGATSSSICRDNTLVVVEYGKIQCWTKREYWGTEALDIKLVHGETTYDCANADATKCQYTQSNEKDEAGNPQWPVISSIAISGTDIVMTGKSFYTALYTVTASYKEIMATSVVIDSDT